MRAATFRSLAVIACALACLAVLAAPAAAATTYSPNLFGDPIGPGLGTQCTPPASPVSCSLRGALAAAQVGDTIKLQAGTYALSSAGELIVGSTVCGSPVPTARPVRWPPRPAPTASPGPRADSRPALTCSRRAPPAAAR